MNIDRASLVKIHEQTNGDVCALPDTASLYFNAQIESCAVYWKGSGSDWVRQPKSDVTRGVGNFREVPVTLLLFPISVKFYHHRRLQLGRRSRCNARDCVDQSRISRISNRTVVSVATTVRMVFQRIQRDSNTSVVASNAESVKVSRS